eukprot:COSAG05_NODE_2946_length_2477_cov_1.764508_3_plen_70_part_00
MFGAQVRLMAIQAKEMAAKDEQIQSAAIELGNSAARLDEVNGELRKVSTACEFDRIQNLHIHAVRAKFY